MVYLTAAVILLGVLCALNLMLTVGVIRRLREHTDELDRLRAVMLAPDGGLPPGSPVPDFAATDTTGAELSRDRLAGAPYVMAFLSTICDACAGQLPDLARYARSLEGGRVVAVVGGDSDEARHYVRELEPVAEVVAGAQAQAIHVDFGMRVLPGYLVVGPDGVVRASCSTVEQLPAHPVDLGLPSG